MADIFTKKKRSLIMSKIKGKLTGLEEKGWLLLKEAGIRFRKHPRGIIGRPDAANKTKKLAIFFDSEFWHGHDWEKSRSKIKSNRDFWIAKIERNIARDKAVNRTLKAEGWTVIRLWERQMKSTQRAKTIKRLANVWRNLG